MSIEVKMPELGENIETADIVKILVSEGDTITAEQPLLELETNKAALELPSSSAGVVSKILVKEGDEAAVGQVLMILEQSQTQNEKEPDRASPEPDKRETSSRVPEDRKESAQSATTDIRTPNSGPPAAPSVRKSARESGVDINQVPGSGAAGRVSIDDVERYAKGRKQTSTPALENAGTDSALPPAPGSPVVAAKVPDFEKWGSVRREKMTNIRRTTARHLTQCWTQIPHVTQFDRADITSLEKLRIRYADKAAVAGGKLTMAVMVVKVAASALKVFPKFNASVDMEKSEIILKDYINIGIAVATERGLLVPALRDTDRKNMIEIAVEVSRLAGRAREGKLSLKDLQGGTFTVTNLGSIGGTHFTPIINWPEAAILGIGRAQMEPGFENGVCTPKVYLPLSLSYDHRIIDGVEGIRFLRWIVDAIEEPLLLSLEG